jgi:hypothetical protein
MGTLWVLAAASLSSCDDAHYANVGRWTGRVWVGRMESLVKGSAIAKRLPFVRFVTGLITGGRRDMKFCAE